MMTPTEVYDRLNHDLNHYLKQGNYPDVADTQMRLQWCILALFEQIAFQVIGKEEYSHREDLLKRLEFVMERRKAAIRAGKVAVN